jgi:hypoxanthine phosphoribosyltransferase
MQGSERFVVPTWEQIYAMLLDLAHKIQYDKFGPDIVLGVSRGGLAPARVLSDLLESPIAKVKVEFYSGVAERKKEPLITEPVSVDVKGMRVLVVDDVSDTGKSLRLVKAHLLEHGVGDLKTATLYNKPWSITLPDYYEETTSDWIVFPWERKETLRKVAEKFIEQGKPVEEALETLVKYGFDRGLAERFGREMFGGCLC